MCGAPTLALDTIYNREVLGDTGQFTSSDPHEIASAIMRLLNDDSERERLSKLTAERAIDYYSWEGVLAKYEESLITALKGLRS
ncbi:glycosyltransferase [Pseudarthrobacter sp. Fe7]|nr:glycosyltransferase [Pseudarthrobacter sp. Fe7]